MPISSSVSSRRASSSGACLSVSPQFVDQLARQRGEIVDEIERVLDLVGDAGCELAERGELFRLDQPVLRLRRSSSEAASSRVRACTSSNRRTFSIAMTAWSAKVCTNFDLPRSRMSRAAGARG